LREKPVNRVLTFVAIALTAAGCTRESLRVAIQAQQRADQVQEFVFQRQHEALCLLLYRDLLRRLEHAGDALTPEQRTALNDVWNERDLFEFWRVQHERVKALRLVGVDAKLYSDQSIVDLLYKAIEAKVDRAAEGMAERAGESVGE
jgi:hypothetical protein